jgi:ActR/RegA family two-component response regulator
VLASNYRHAQASWLPPPATFEKLGTVRILLVEDEVKAPGFIVRGLEAERFAVDAAYGRASDLDLATTYNYNSIILDLPLALNGTVGGARRNDP